MTVGDGERVGRQGAGGGARGAAGSPVQSAPIRYGPGWLASNERRISNPTP